MKQKIIFLFFLMGTLLLPKPAEAHDMSLTYTSITLSDSSITLDMTTPENNIRSLYLKDHPEIDPAQLNSLDTVDLAFFTKHLTNGFVINNNDARCTPRLKEAHQITDIHAVNFIYTYSCPGKLTMVRFSYHLFFDVSETHENITDVHMDTYTNEVILSRTRTDMDVAYEKTKNNIAVFHLFTNIVNFLKIGIFHILTGYDHILFLLSLLIITKRFQNLLKIITAFTLAHSLTLTLAALNIFLLPARFTESMIALSIAYVAFENVRILSPTKSGKKWYQALPTPHLSKRWLVALLFGLIHGFGFSSVLREMGLPKDGLLASLISFNVGVEIGQLVIILLLFPLLWYIRQQRWEERFVKNVSLLIGCIGLFWFLQRLFFS